MNGEYIELLFSCAPAEIAYVPPRPSVEACQARRFFHSPCRRAAAFGVKRRWRRRHWLIKVQFHWDRDGFAMTGASGSHHVLEVLPPKRLTHHVTPSSRPAFDLTGSVHADGGGAAGKHWRGTCSSFSHRRFA
jgi:hypothetical protein